jgi:hypothetical protein
MSFRTDDISALSSSKWIVWAPHMATWHTNHADLDEQYSYTILIDGDEYRLFYGNQENGSEIYPERNFLELSYLERLIMRAEQHAIIQYNAKDIT